MVDAAPVHSNAATSHSVSRRTFDAVNFADANFADANF